MLWIKWCISDTKTICWEFNYVRICCGLAVSYMFVLCIFFNHISKCVVVYITQMWVTYIAIELYVVTLIPNSIDNISYKIVGLILVLDVRPTLRISLYKCRCTRSFTFIYISYKGIMILMHISYHFMVQWQ